jgi:hypothetical protein
MGLKTIQEHLWLIFDKITILKKSNEKEFIGLQKKYKYNFLNI